MNVLPEGTGALVEEAVKTTQVIVETNSLRTRQDGSLGTESTVTTGDDEKAVALKTAAEKLLLRKLDLCLVPTLALMFMMNLLDRKGVTLAPLDGMMEDLKLGSVQYSTGIAVFYVGYILGQIPSNMLITKIPPSRWLAASMFAWAVVATLTCLIRDFRGLILCRFFLGLTQSPFAPGAFFLLSTFYTRRELSIRFSWVVMGAVMGSNLSSFVALGTFKLGGVAGLDGWRWLFIIQGLITVVVAVVALWVLPDSPQCARWLTPEQRLLAEERTDMDTAGVKKLAASTIRGLIDALKDPNLWIFALIKHMANAEAGFKNFLPTIIETFGYGKTATLILMCGPGCIGGIADIIFSYSSSHWNERVWHVTGLKSTAILGFILFCTIVNPVARYMFVILIAIGGTGPTGIINGWFPCILGQSREKKASALAIINAVASSADIWTPYLFPDFDAPGYFIGMSVGASATVLCILSVWAVRYCLTRANKRLRADESYTGPLYPL